MSGTNGRDLPGKRRAQYRAAVKTQRKADDRRAPRGLTRDLYRILNSFGTGREQKRFLLKRTRCQRVHPLRDRNVPFVQTDLNSRMREGIELLANRGNDRRMTVPDVERSDAAGEIDELAAVLVPNPGAFGASDGEQRMGRSQTPWNGGIPAFQ
jgi:hypothetical protein